MDCQSSSPRDKQGDGDDFAESARTRTLHRILSFGRVYDFLHTATLAFLLFVTVLALRAASGEHVPVLQATCVGIGLLLIVTGNFLGKVRRNFFVGIRTPWTLANEEVWLRTHRLGGKTFVLGGVLMLASVGVGASVGLCSLVAVVAALVPAVYSYVVYRRLEHRSQ